LAKNDRMNRSYDCEAKLRVRNQKLRDIGAKLSSTLSASLSSTDKYSHSQWFRIFVKNNKLVSYRLVHNRKQKNSSGSFFCKAVHVRK
jgi:hypothetical protein